MLERHAADLARQLSRLCVQWLKAGVLDLVVAEHLLDEQQRVGSHVQLAATARLRPVERGQQTPILGDVIRRVADGLREFLDERAVSLFDADTKPGGPGIAPCAAVDIGDERGCCHCADCVAASGAGDAAGAGTKYRNRLQLSHCTICSFRRTVLNTCGRIRTWQIVQMPSRASATATPLRRLATSSSVQTRSALFARTTSDRSAATRSSVALSSAD